MGYTTDFTGQFSLDRLLTPEHKLYLKHFNTSRRMKRFAEKTNAMPDPVRLACGLPVGKDGAYFVGAKLLEEEGNWETCAGQKRTSDIQDYNEPPSGQPGLWCQWVPTENGDGIEWDQGEKFYDYVEWLKYLIENFLKPWGYVLNGEVTWAGEDRDDLGQITVLNNTVKVRKGVVTYLD